jgi:hypothetical protein
MERARMAFASNLGSADIHFPLDGVGKNAGSDSGSVPPSFKGESERVNRCGFSQVLADTGSRAIPTLMPDERAIVAISRIERALARIEAAARRAPPASANDDELLELRQRHQALRDRVQGAVSQIDQLLAGRGGE